MEMTEIAQQMRDKLRTIIRTNNFDVVALFNEPREENPRINKMILELLGEFMETKVDGQNLFDKENRTRFMDILHKQNVGFGDRTLNCIIRTYLGDIWEVFVKAERGRVVSTGAETFELPVIESDDMESLEKNSQYIEKKMGNIYLNKNRQLALFILPDGKCFYAPKGHMSLATWLNLNAVDIKGALRLEVNDVNNTIDLSSLGASEFSKSSNDDILIEITEEQANVFASIFKAVKLKRKRDVSLEDCLYNSWGLGFSRFDFHEKEASKNLRRISWNFDDFDKNRFMKLLIDFHSLKNGGQAGEDE